MSEHFARLRGKWGRNLLRTPFVLAFAPLNLLNFFLLMPALRWAYRASIVLDDLFPRWEP